MSIATAAPAKPVLEVGFRLLSSETFPLTLEAARRHAEMEPSPTERALNLQRVKHLKWKLDAGLFITCQWATVDYQGKTWRMNGQHSSHVLCDADPFPDGLNVHLDHYQADTEHGMGLLFRQFDDRRSSRSGLDVSHAYQGLYEQVRDLDMGAAYAGVQGIRFYNMQTGEGMAPSKDDVGLLFDNRQYDPFLRFVAELLTSKTPELKNDGVLAAAFGTFEASRQKAIDFWQEVAKGGVVAGSAAELLDETLRRNKEQTDTKKKLKPISLYGVAVKAWNYHLSGEKLPGVFKHDPKKPLPEIVS